MMGKQKGNVYVCFLGLSWVQIATMPHKTGLVTVQVATSASQKELMAVVISISSSRRSPSKHLSLTGVPSHASRASITLSTYQVPSILWNSP